MHIGWINFSTKNSIQKLNFTIDSPIYLELQRIINTSKFDEETQIKIEQFLNNQGSILLKNRIDQNSDINYYKINPYILGNITKSIDELNKLIDNYRTNINNSNNNIDLPVFAINSSKVFLNVLLGPQLFSQGKSWGITV